MSERNKLTYKQILRAVGNRLIHVEPVGGWRQQVVDRTSRRTVLVGGPEWAVDAVSCWSMADVQRVVHDYDARRREP